MGSNGRSSNRTIPIEDQLRAKFLDETSPTDPIVNETNRSGKKQATFIDTAHKVNTAKKTVQMFATATTVEIENTNEYSDESYTESLQENKSRKSKWARRPSVNPALLDLSSSSEESSTETETESEDDLPIHNPLGRRMTLHYQPPEEEPPDKDREEFTRILRRTLVENRRNLRSLEEQNNKDKDGKDLESIAEKPKLAGFKRFKDTATAVKVAQTFITTAAEKPDDGRASTTSSAEKDDYWNSSKHSRSTIGDEESFQRLHRGSKRRGGIGRKTDYDLREHMLSLANEAETNTRWVINPFSKFRFYWDIATVVVILVNVITLPLEFSLFSDSTDLDFLKAFTDCWFTIDMMFNFRTGIPSAHGRQGIVMNPTDIRKQYFRSWFIVDLASSIPFDMLVSKIDGTYDVGDAVGQASSSLTNLSTMTRFLKILKLLRLLRLGRFVRYLHRWEEVLSMDYGTGENIIKGISWILMMLIICHYNACVLYLTPTMAADDGVRPDYPNGTAREDNAYGPKETLDMSWFYVSDLQSMEKTQQYFWCLFKSMSHMREVDDYLRFQRCSRNLKSAVKEYYDFHYRQRVFDEELIFSELNPILLEEVTTCGIIEYIQDCELFRTCRFDFQQELCKLFKVEMYQPYTYIVLSGRSARTFSIIRQGVISMESDNDRRGHYYHLEEGDSYGLEAFASLTNPRYATSALTETWVEVLEIKITKLRELGSINPEYRDAINLIDSLANQQLKQSGIFNKMMNKTRELRKFYGP